MKVTFFERVVFTCVLFILVGALVHAEQDKKPPNEANPKFAFSERFRFVSWDNAIDLDDSQSDLSTFTRHRTSIGIEWQPLKNLEIVGKITNEFRYYFEPDNREFALHEVFFDQLYFKWQKPFGISKATLKIGRQNIILGEGFLVMDGHPLDGSRSIYFNALRLDLSLNKKSNLTFFYTYQPVTDTFPVINDHGQALIEQPEEGYAAYFQGMIGSADIDAYYIRKNIRGTAGLPENSGINTFGTRLQIPFTRNLYLMTEAASQTGWIENRSRSAFGGYFRLRYEPKNKLPLPSRVVVGGIYLSGDDQNTSDYEAWDPLFSRWPKWSESYIYTLIKESRVAYWSNIASIYARLRFDLFESSFLAFSYYRLGAAETDLREKSFPGGTGKVRGDLFTAKLKVSISDNLTGHLLWESFKPGDFYFDGADGYNWFRFNLLYKIGN